ncbi:MAG: Asp-tRNA(Asn)/Glu-tRNA(Gln) amidotransferase subunit GatC [Ignavibacteriales bacterium]|nr:Asp-tRNA(Asn)/Glu-tRNA(Gln) amidotransferase subunit GatC [Ignavibacteriales bacterium]MCF8305632.1 Asp-tRNA(Asn)/Glu-tRNA(Gln) amidotransferase subunit GatC [Ignavibacteriales bacterium]MCF8315354.1 Asp-tRNA(Asn)/Glu-tRNA(Gln) amidotransferase subunit GatC [Ignavibacteriales bacterium]MCF8436754.1 Asp-tRNA(Asn)/Glu-tRNA(Gln) amidotransferase subunit GatC [Ignavibacteriales bacterium]
MSVTPEDVIKIASLAKLKIDESEISQYTSELNKILDYMKTLDEIDTSSVKPLLNPLEGINAFREDKKKESLPREEALKNAPATDGEYFLVPKVVKGKN